MKLGVIGTSEISYMFTTAALKAGFRLAAVYSRDGAKGALFCEHYKSGEAAGSLEELIRLSDAVYIAAPPALHYRYALAAAGAGRHVLVEKPCFRTLAELDGVLEAASKTGAFVLETMRLFYSPLSAALKNALGRVGTLRYAYFNYMRYSSKYDDYKAGVLAPSFSLELGGGALSDLGVYALYTALLLFGKPEETLARAIKLESGADGNAALILGYPDFNCVISASKQSTSHIPSEIQGEEGSLVIENPFMRSTVTLCKGQTRELVARQDYDDMLIQLQELYKILREKDSARAEHARRFMRDSTELLETLRL
ncbi:MAG: Gfo/Idh/MocA family oxidoreductase [Spirochaetaceae bacterium]|jgi:predicted dehydrogenase|nr:Gfo/Idh/MocA family oxidoreductase [Spirochaetaceae bacterium]